MPDILQSLLSSCSREGLRAYAAMVVWATDGPVSVVPHSGLLDMVLDGFLFLTWRLQGLPYCS